MDHPFFDSLKDGYSHDFEGWFRRKNDEDLYIVTDEDGDISGMLYLKSEIGSIEDVDPHLPSKHWLKVGTLKIDSRGTRLGERVVKKIFDTAISEHADGVYVTVFEIHVHLIKLLRRYGFREWGTKTTKNGVELVFVRDLRSFSGDILTDYPFIHTSGKKYWLLAIKPRWHTELLPDSILRNEPREIVQDVSHTNTIHKVYIGHVSFDGISKGDSIIFYRTMDRPPAYFRSVATSVCVVEEVRGRRDFANEDAFIRYCHPRSVYTEAQLRDEWQRRGVLSVVKITYNAAFNRRLTRGVLLEEINIRPTYWVLLNITEMQFRDILELGGVDESLIID
ncbi:hypothetical protein J2X36_005097 [Methylobacterium sp. BE186]|uniref:N-acetyltransferase n=1 Tax=Methylobacterium sp. BE186 TaxID=2817715 RepID=UPI00285FACFB|nr:N-acetyltransferase [Methylobacterium sp. BE186]MDR7040315.1 hypothetical protein [Methylobacterium sp. BE186]